MLFDAGGDSWTVLPNAENPPNGNGCGGDPLILCGIDLACVPC